VADRPLRPATRRCLGEPLPHQQADRSRVHPEAQKHFLNGPCDPQRVSGINPGFPGLSRSSGQVTHVILTRSPLRHTQWLPTRYASLDLHALGAPPAFVLSQDQTLQRTFMSARSYERASNPVQRAHCFLNAPALVRGSKHLEYVPPFQSRRTCGANRYWLLAHCLVVKEPQPRLAGSARAAVDCSTPSRQLPHWDADTIRSQRHSRRGGLL
jgi:hypothetical protein